MCLKTSEGVGEDLGSTIEEGRSSELEMWHASCKGSTVARLLSKKVQYASPPPDSSKSLSS